MISPFAIPLGAFAAVALVVALVQLAKMREKEIESHHELYREEVEQQRKMKELEIELERIRNAEAKS